MKFINILRKLQALLGKQAFLFTDICKEWTVTNSNRFTGRIFKYVRKLKMANTQISETKNDIEKFQFTHEDITERTPLRNKLHHFKSFQEKPRRKTEAV